MRHHDIHVCTCTHAFHIQRALDVPLVEEVVVVQTWTCRAVGDAPEACQIVGIVQRRGRAFTPQLRVTGGAAQAVIRSWRQLKPNGQHKLPIRHRRGCRPQHLSDVVDDFKSTVKGAACVKLDIHQPHGLEHVKLQPARAVGVVLASGLVGQFTPVPAGPWVDWLDSTQNVVDAVTAGNGRLLPCPSKVPPTSASYQRNTCPASACAVNVTGPGSASVVSGDVVGGTVEPLKHQNLDCIGAHDIATQVLHIHAVQARRTDLQRRRRRTVAPQIRHPLARRQAPRASRAQVFVAGHLDRGRH